MGVCGVFGSDGSNVSLAILSWDGSVLLFTQTLLVGTRRGM